MCSLGYVGVTAIHHWIAIKSNCPWNLHLLYLVPIAGPNARDLLNLWSHDDVIKWKHFPRHWPFVRHWSLWGEFTGDRWIPLTKTSDAELWCFLWSAPKQTVCKRSRRRWLETASRSLWRHCNDVFCEGAQLTIVSDHLNKLLHPMSLPQFSVRINIIHQKHLFTLHWRHNGHDGVSNHQPYGCLLNCLFRRRSKKTSKLPVTGLCAGNSPKTGEFPAQRASYAENVSIWWSHHEMDVIWLQHSRLIPMYNARFIMWPSSLSSHTDVQRPFYSVAIVALLPY